MFDHFRHKFKEVWEVLDKKKAEIQSVCSALEQAPPTLSRAEAVLKVAINEVDARHAEIKKEIEDAFSPLLMAVERRRKSYLQMQRQWQLPRRPC